MTLNDNDRQPMIFLGGLFPPDKADEILQQSRAPVQFAADTLQRAFLRGFVKTAGVPIKVVSLPFVGSYPFRNRRLRFPQWSSSFTSNVIIEGRPFLNLQFFKYVSRFLHALAGLQAATPPGAKATIIVYSAHLPFLAAANLFMRFRSDIILCVILPDLPEFMGVGGPVYSFLKKVETLVFRKLIASVDCFVLLTDAMGDRLGIPPERRVVVEGIFDSTDETSESYIPSEPPSGSFPILYTGTLAARYGIVDLLDAFELLDLPQANLWICGDGDCRSQVEKLARHDNRVKYFGQVSRTQALALQRQASVLVNPRRAEGEYTKYSFPSKTMEYLASGTPVVMHPLPGVPEDYLGYLAIPSSQDAAGLANILKELYNRPTDELTTLGMQGRSFILKKKNPETQTRKVLDCLQALEARGRKRSATRSEATR